MAIVGIDLGTTNSLVGRIEKGRPRLFTGEDGKALVPSVVAFDESGAAVAVGAGAKDRRASAPERTISSAKRFIGRGAGDVDNWQRKLPFDFSASDEQMIRFTIGKKAYTPIEIGALVLRKLKNLAETQSGETVDKAVITVPAYFNDAQRQATKFAGELAGLEVARIVNEPTAACLAYGLDKKSLGTIAVFDLGGGTFDISILRVKDGVFEVLATNGDTALGGDDFDHAIAEALGGDLHTAWGADALKDPVMRARLVLAAESLKRTLSESEKTLFRFEAEGRTFEREVTRQELTSWILPQLSRAEAPCRQCLTDAGLKREQITDVILVGGSTRVPAVRERVQELFGREPICTINPDEVVAMGATVQANILAGQMGEMLLLDVTPLTLGIETMGGVVGRIIHRNSTIPVSASQTFSTYVDGQTAVAIHVVQGERELVPDVRSLARFELRGLPPLPAGVPKIEVEFIVDANGILAVRAMELRTGKTASITVNPSYGLNDTEVERMLLESYEHAESDFESRFLIEARNEAETILHATRKSLEPGRKLVSAEDVAKIEAAVAELERSLASTDRKEIKSKSEALNEATRGLAEALLNHAVGGVLKDRQL